MLHSCLVLFQDRIILFVLTVGRWQVIIPIQDNRPTPTGWYEKERGDASRMWGGGLPAGRKAEASSVREEQIMAQHEKQFTIIVNARRKTVSTEELTFEQIVALAFDPVPTNSFFTVTYSGGVHHQEGSLQPGQSTEIKDGMQFYVTETGQS